MNDIGTTLQDLFTLDFSRTEIVVISLLPSLINLVFFAYILVALPKTKINILFASFTFFVSMWQLADGFMRLAVNQSTAEDWNYIMGIYSLMVTPMGLIFIVNFNKWQNRIPNGILMLSQFIPATFFICVNVGRVKTHEVVHSDYWYWIANPNEALITKFIYGWVSIQGVIMLVLVWLNTYMVRKNRAMRNQSLLLSIGFTIPVVGGIAAQSVVPLLLKMDNFPITAPLFTFFSLFTFISVLKYQLLEFNPKHQWDKIVESMNEGLLIINLKHEIMYANKLFCKATGFTYEELIYSSANARFLNNEFPYTFESNKGSYELLIASKNGEKIWFMINLTPYKDNRGNTTGYTILYTNINDSKRSEEKFKALVENAGDIISLTDKDAKLIYVSPALEKVLGYSADDIKDSTIFDLMHPEHAEEARRSFHFVIENPGTLIPRLTRFITKSNKEVWAEGAIINLLHDENVQAIVSNHRDISERKNNEAKIQKFIEVTSDQNNRLQNFAHIVSHNIRSHVVNISGIVEILSLTENENEKENLMTMLKASTGKLSETTDNLNDIITIQNKIDKGWLELNLKNEIIKTHDSINSISNNNNTKIINLVQDDISVNVIPSYLESILLNLMTNAIKYRSPQRDPEITLFTEDDDEHIILNVNDNGIGIDLNIHGKKLFGMYKTFHNHKDARGLGLFITKNQIEAMDGKIFVESEPEKGTNFKIYFKKKLSA